MGEKPQIIILSNDIVPGMDMPCAAPGLRAFGLASGLRAGGFPVRILITRQTVKLQMNRWGRRKALRTPAFVDVLPQTEVKKYIRHHSPAVVIMINSVFSLNLEKTHGVYYILDFFAPKILEVTYQSHEANPKQTLQGEREKKQRAIELAEAFIVNGRKKLPYFLGWVAQSQHDISQIPVEVVNMCIPLHLTSPRDAEVVRYGMTGYLQHWSKMGVCLDVIERHLKKGKMELDILLPSRYWGHLPSVHPEKDKLEGLIKLSAVRKHAPMEFGDFQKFVSTIDVSIDLFQRNLEREYAMVTRSIVALACGRPVVHPTFTEVSPLVSDYDAGWLVDVEEIDKLDKTLEEINQSPDLVRKKATNAARLAKECLDPAVAVKPLINIILELAIDQEKQKSGVLLPKDTMCTAGEKKPDDQKRECAKPDNDIERDQLGRVLDVSDHPDSLLEIVRISRELFGFYTKQASRSIEFVWQHQKTKKYKGKNILDVCPGVSPLPVILARQGNWVCTLDDSPTILEFGKDQHTWNDQGFLDFSRIDKRIQSRNEHIHEVRFDDGLFDCIYCVDFYEHVPLEDREATCRKLRHWIRPSGSLLLTVSLHPNTDKIWQSNNSVIQMNLDTIITELKAQSLHVDSLDINRKRLLQQQYDVALIHLKKS